LVITTLVKVVGLHLDVSVTQLAHRHNIDAFFFMALGWRKFCMKQVLYRVAADSYCKQYSHKYRVQYFIQRFSLALSRATNFLK